MYCRIVKRLFVFVNVVIFFCKKVGKYLQCYDFCDFLLKNGIKEISHEKTPINNSTYEEKHFWEYYDTFVLNFVNSFFDEDFKNFGFEKYDNVLDFYYQMNKKFNPYKEY